METIIRDYRFGSTHWVGIVWDRAATPLCNASVPRPGALAGARPAVVPSLSSIENEGVAIVTINESDFSEPTPVPAMDESSLKVLQATRELFQSQDPGPRLFIRQLREDFTRMEMEYRAGINEVLTKVTILREEFLHLHRYNPIEHINSRIKTTKSILEKVIRKGLDPSMASIRENITDIAGIRVTCSFIADTYRILEALTSQHDVRVLEIKDYIANPKPSGYKSLHAIIEIPVFLSTGPIPVVVEIQIRTIAMDFWASLEHKIFYKYDGDVPAHLAMDLLNAAYLAEQLDQRMEQLHREIHGDPLEMDEGFVANSDIDDALLMRMWEMMHESRGGDAE